MSVVTEMPKLKDRLRKLRLSLQLRQKEMADRLDVGIGTYRNWEYGKKTPGKLAAAELDRRIEQL